MPHYNLVQTLNTGKPARFSANGKRISRDDYEYMVAMAMKHGKYDCLSTRSWPLNNGGTKRKNYACARWEVKS